MMKTFLGTQPIPSELAFTEIEKIARFRLPADFREHWSITNGGSPVDYHFLFESGVFLIQQFLSIKLGESELLQHYQDLSVMLPQGYLPFAYDPGGNYYCITESGEIFYWNAEHWDESDHGLEKIASSLPIFIEGLCFSEKG